MDESQLLQTNLKDKLPFSQLTSNNSSINCTPASSQRTSTRSSPVNTPLTPAALLVSKPSLNPYIKITVIRSATDVVLCDDLERPGRKRQIVVGSLADQKQEESELQSENKGNNNKRDIPVPTITTVRQYALDVPADYVIPQYYIRYNHPTYDEVDEVVEYNIDAEDEAWWKNDKDFGPESKARVVWEGEDIINLTSNELLISFSPEDVIAQNPRYFMSPHSTRWLIQQHRPRLPLSVLEQMMDVLEKATGFETIITVAQAEKILSKKVPILIDIFGHGALAIKERLKNNSISTQNSTSATEVPARIPAFAPPITLVSAIHKVYSYWMQKRSRLKKPLLRRFWPATSLTDNNPHMVFRPRDKEKRKLRKKRQNDVDSYKKLKMLKVDFDRVKTLCDLIVRREGITSLMVELTNEYYQQRLYEWLDTSGEPRKNSVFTKDIVEKVLDVPKYYDDGPIILLKSKKRKRSSALGSSVLEIDQSSFQAIPIAAIAPAEDHIKKEDIVIAGHDGGLPAPSFLDPLPSRESHITNWNEEAPFVPYCENGKEVKVSNFQHRARIGRGGRIIIDRTPYLSGFSSASRAMTYGSGNSAVGYHTSTLGADGEIFNAENPSSSKVKNNIQDAPRSLPPESVSDLLPPSLDSRFELSHRIQEICAKGILEDAQQKQQRQEQKIADPGNDTDEILIPLDKFLGAPPDCYGQEKYIIGPF